MSYEIQECQNMILYLFETKIYIYFFQS